MLKNLIWLQLVLVNMCYAQNIKMIELLSEQDSTAIEYAHIFLDEKLITTSDELGNFGIDMNSEFKTIMIKHLSFQSKEISKADCINMLEVYMEENENFLEEVVISTKKNPKHYMLLPEKSVKEYFMKSLDVVFPYEFKSAVYIPNEFKNDSHNIENIVFETRKGVDNPDSKYIPFMVNLMKVDSLTLLPKEKLFKEDLVVGKRENQKLMLVDVSEYNIEFPKEGIFVVVSMYDKDYYESHGFIERPGFGQTQISKNSKFFELYWIRTKGTWDEPNYSKNRIQCRNFGIELIEN